MKIELKEPFLNNYKAAYLNTNKEPRRVVLLVKKDGSKTSMSYARYIMTCHLKRFLYKHEHVDHIDNNKLNDVIENLQILSPRENNIKSIKHSGRSKKPDVKLICPVCKTEFVRPFHRVNFRIIKGVKPCCSRKCGGIYSHR